MPNQPNHLRLLLDPVNNKATTLPTTSLPKSADPSVWSPIHSSSPSGALLRLQVEPSSPLSLH
jgi:hypothetical protein